MFKSPLCDLIRLQSSYVILFTCFSREPDNSSNMSDLNCQSSSLVSALTAFAFLVSSTCLFYRPVIITRSSRVLISVCCCVNGSVVFSQSELNSCRLFRMGNFTSSAPGLSSSACNQFVQVSFTLVCFGSINGKVHPQILSKLLTHAVPNPYDCPF